MNLQDEAIDKILVKWQINDVRFAIYKRSLKATLVRNPKLGAANFGATSGETLFEG